MAYLLRCKNLGKSFKEGNGEKKIFSHLDFTFPSKGLFAICGKSGCGKSTLLSLLSGLDVPSEGEVYFCLKKLSSFSNSAMDGFRKNDISFLFQHMNLVDGLDVLDNITLPLLLKGEKEGKAKKTAMEFLKAVGLEGKAKSSIKELSGGQRQRVAFCRALINKPKIVFADEPTGALDEENGFAIMNLLKKTSSKRLVIIVSHNKDLVNQFCDGVLNLDLKNPKPTWSSNQIEGKHNLASKRSNSAWQRKMLLSHLQENIWKNGLGVLASFVGFTSLLCAAGYYQGYTPALKEACRASLSFPFARIVEKEAVEIPGSPLQLVREKVPNNEIIPPIYKSESYSIVNDLSYFLPSSFTFLLNGQEKDACLFSPCADLSLNEFGGKCLKEGLPPGQNSFSSVLVNTLFVKSYNAKIGDVISFSNEVKVEWKGAYDTLPLKFNFEIVGVVEEFSFMNSAKAYYSYSGLEKYLASFELSNISKQNDMELNAISILPLTSSDSYLTNQGLWLFARGEEAASRLFENQLASSSSELSYDSASFQAAQSFLSLSEAFSLALVLFVGISFLGLVMILGMSSYSNFANRVKENAILFALGVNKKQLMNLYAEEGILCGFAGFLIALISSPVTSRAFNAYLLSKFGISNLIRIPLLSFLGIPFLFPLLLGLIAAILPFVSISIPLGFRKNTRLFEELRDE